MENMKLFEPKIKLEVPFEDGDEDAAIEHVCKKIKLAENVQPVSEQARIGEIGGPLIAQVKQENSFMSDCKDGNNAPGSEEHTPEKPDVLADRENSFNSGIEHVLKRMKLDDYHVPKENDPGVGPAPESTPHDGGDLGNADIADKRHVPDNTVASNNSGVHEHADVRSDGAAAPFVINARPSVLRSLLRKAQPASGANAPRSVLRERLVPGIRESEAETAVTRGLRRAEWFEEELLKFQIQVQSCEKLLNNIKADNDKLWAVFKAQTRRQASIDAKLKTVLKQKSVTSREVADFTDVKPRPVRSKVATSFRPAVRKRLIPLPMSPSKPVPCHSSWKPVPPRPIINLLSTTAGIVLILDMPMGLEHEVITKYQLYGYQEDADDQETALWRFIAEMTPLRLPSACPLPSFTAGCSYHFAVRGVDVHGREGLFSYPSTLLMKQKLSSNNN